MARVGTRVGDYQLEGVIGEGGTGVVYRGRLGASDRPVAITILREPGGAGKDVVEQRLGQASPAGRLHHANLVEVLETGVTSEGTAFVVTEYLEGEGLQDRLHRVARLPLFEAINIVRQVAHGLDAASAAGVVHGGLEPANVFLCRRAGRRRIVRRSKTMGMRLVVEPEESFDLVKLLDVGMPRPLDVAPNGAAAGGTRWGMPHYLSPEQARGQAPDLRSDIYALGAIFYEMVTGTVPFEGESAADVIKAHLSGFVMAPSRRAPSAGIGGHVDTLILRCLKKTPSLRFASMDELCEALDACTTDCAFLRDAHRVPGIRESGIDLSDASPEARMPTTVNQPAAAVHAPPPPVPLSSDLLTELPDEAADAPSPRPTQPPEPTRLALEVDPEPFDLENGAFPRLFGRWRRWQVIAVSVGLLLGGAGIWAARTGAASREPRPGVTAAIAPAAAPKPAARPVSPLPVTASPTVAVAPASPAVAAAPVPVGRAADPPTSGPAIGVRAASSPGVPESAAQPDSAKSRSRSGAAQRTTPKSSAQAQPTPRAPASASDLIRQAQLAWMGGQNESAVGKAQAALEVAPTPAQAMQAYEIIATCSCALRKRDAALSAASHLDSARRDTVKAACEKSWAPIE